MSGFRTLVTVAAAVAVGFGGFHAASDVIAETGWLQPPAAVADEPLPSPPRVTTPPSPSPTLSPSPSPSPRPRPLMALGDSGRDVRELQVRLRRAGVFTAGMTGYFGTVTQKSVRRYQERHGFAITGEVDKATWRRLVSRTGTVTSRELYPPKPKATATSAGLDPRCKVGRVVCIDKTARRIRWVVDGDVQYSMSARFGGRSTPTREGTFAIEWKDRDHVSSLYESRMPFSMFFSRGQAIHYSADFARKGYAGASHGCVNTRSWSLTERLFEDTRIGDTVVIYRS